MIIPLIDRIIFRKVDIEQKTASGIILAATEISETRDVEYGEVVEVGEGKDGKELKCKVGDIIIFNHRMPMRWVYTGNVLHIIRESDVFAILRDENLTISAYSENKGAEYQGNKAKMLG